MKRIVVCCDGTPGKNTNTVWPFEGLGPDGSEANLLIPDGAKIHRSVLQRMSDPDIGYRPSNLPGSYVEVN